MAHDDKERPLPASLSTPPKKEDTTVETLDNMMARLRILEDVKEQNEALVQELKEIREERRSEGVLENLMFSQMILLHISTLCINEPLVRLNMVMELVLFQDPWEGILKRKSITLQGEPIKLIQEELDM
jgi:hypothetical protein